MAPGPQAFYCLWQDKEIRERLFDLLSKEEICNVRLASSACCNLVTKRLFLRTHLTFTANTFTRQSRIEALSRIGHHIEHLTFYFPHSDATFLPPLVHPETGREISFLYAPHTSMASVLERPKFANSSLGEILTLQYPPLFHAASNVPSFINAMKHLRNMRHITIKTPGQDPKERYRRDIVDYALISLRISLERAPLHKLTKLTLSSVHPSAFIYLRHTSGFGCLPSAVRRWRQIRKLHVSVESWDFYGPAPGRDHLKLIDDFVRGFAPGLEKFAFAWQGRFKGPCPLSLAADPLFAPPRSSRKLFHEVTSPMSPLPPAPPRQPVVFRRVRYLAVRNATMSAPQVADLVRSHRHCVREFDFENVVLVNGDSWDDALAPLTGRNNNDSRAGGGDGGGGGDHWTRYSSATIEEVRSVHCFPEVVAEDLPTHSAAVAAVSHELLHLDANLFRDEDEEEDESQEAEDTYLTSDVEAARKASLAFPNKLKKRRVTKRRRKRKESHPRREEEATGAYRAEHHRRERRHRREHSEESSSGSGSGSSSPSPPEKQQQQQHHPRRFWHKRPKDKDTSPAEEPSPHQQPAASSSSSASAASLLPASAYSTPSRGHSRQPSSDSLRRRPQEPPQIAIPHRPSRGRLFGEVDGIYSATSSPASSRGRRLFGEITPLCSGSEPDLSHSPIDEEDEESVLGGYFRPKTPPTPTPHSAAFMPKPTVPTPLPLLPSAMPRTTSSRYSDYSSGISSNHTATPVTTNGRRDMDISAPILDTAPGMPALLQPTVYDPTADLCSEITAVQRDLEAEEAQRRVAEDAEAQVGALRRAKELVLSRLAGRDLYGSGGGGGNGGSGSAPKKESFLSSARFREGLFGRSSNSILSAAREQLLQQQQQQQHYHHNQYHHQQVDHRSMDVPILFSRG